jgi:anti-anti-sigma factor
MASAKLHAQDRAGVTVICIDGSLTSTDVQQIEPEFKKLALVPGRRLVIDLSKVEMLATPAITMFMSAMMFQRSHNGRVIFTGTDGAIDKLLHICRLDLIMTIIHDSDAAVAQAAR